jgi:hypothetical protein
LPDGVSKLSFSTRATEGDVFTHEVADGVDFEVNRRADASVKRIFALHWAAGSEVTEVRTELARQPNGEWSVVLQFQYAEA